MSSSSEGGRVRVDPDRCNGFGNCTIIAPEVFAIDPDTDVASVLPGHPGVSAAVDRAVHDCPARAISVSPGA